MKSAYKFLNHKKNYSPNRKLQINKPDLSMYSAYDIVKYKKNENEL
jgi:hypothetical protein